MTGRAEGGDKNLGDEEDRNRGMRKTGMGQSNMEGEADRDRLGRQR